MREFLCKPLGAGEPETPTFIDDPLSDYVVDEAIESSVITDGNQVDMWYQFAGDDVYYGYSTDPALQAWTLGGAPVLAGRNYPYVTKNGSTYYMACTDAQTDGDLYLYSSIDKTTWSVMNGGNPIFTHSADTANTYHNIYNASLLFVGGTLYLMLDHHADGQLYRMSIASSTLAALDFSNITVIISGTIAMANPNLHYIPERDAFLLIASTFVGSKQQINAWFAPGTSDLFNPLSWIQTNLSYGHTGVHTSDPHLVELPAYFNHRLLLSYNYDQSSDQAIRESNTLSQAFNELTLVQFYDQLVKSL